MANKTRKRSRKSIWAVLLFLVLLASWFPLSGFLAGVFSGGGRHPESGGLEIYVLSAMTQQPVEGARILVDGFETTSDARGRAVVSGLSGGPVRIEASHGGHSTTTWADPATENEIRIALTRPEPRRGRVTLPDGRPAAGVVRLLDEEGRELARSPLAADGSYELPERADAHCVCAQPDDAAPAVAIGGDLVLQEGEEIRGRLLGGGAGDLEIFGRMPQPDDDAVLPFHCVWTVGKDGTFRGRLPAGQAWGTYAGLAFVVRGGDIELPKPVTASGTVTRFDGSPAAGAELHFRALLDADFAVPLPPFLVRADGQGRFLRTGLAEGRYSVEVRAEGCATMIVNDVTPGGLEIELDRGFSVSGMVVDAAGQPVATARLNAIARPDPDGKLPVIRTRTGARGRFLLAGLGGVAARIQVTAPGHSPTTRDQRGAASGLRIILQKG